MPSTLAQLEARVAAYLYDAANTVFSLATVDEGLRQALHEYSLATPLTMETYITLPAAGREIALNGVAGLLEVHEVWWPFNPDSETWPPNRVRGFRVWWDDQQPVLFIDVGENRRRPGLGTPAQSVIAPIGLYQGNAGGAQPQSGDNVRLWYSKSHTIQNLDAASVTTILTSEHESLIVVGAAGHCCRSRSIDLAETAANQAVSTPNYAALAQRMLREFRHGDRVGTIGGLAAIKNEIGVGEPFGQGWLLDKWDGSESW